MLRKLGGIMVVTINLAVVFIVTVLGTENCGTNRASKMIDMEFPIHCCDI